MLHDDVEANGECLGTGLGFVRQFTFYYDPLAVQHRDILCLWRGHARGIGIAIAILAVFCVSLTIAIIATYTMAFNYWIFCHEWLWIWGPPGKLMNLTRL
jgi:hypothetical protein